MRLSTANLFDASIANLQRRQNALQDQQQQLTCIGQSIGVHPMP